MRGNSNKIRNIDGHHLISYSIQTTPGQSGSPVFVKADHEDGEWQLVGIHVGTTRVDDFTYENVATLLNDRIYAWIKSWFVV
jgi:V8-like Glu-specific endopeptidase